MCHGEVGLEPDRLAAGGCSAGQVALPAKGVAKVVVRIGEVALEPDRLAVFRRGAGQVASVGQGMAEVQVDAGAVRPEGDRCRVIADRLVEPARLRLGEGHTQVMIEPEVGRVLALDLDKHREARPGVDPHQGPERGAGARAGPSSAPGRVAEQGPQAGGVLARDEGQERAVLRGGDGRRDRGQPGVRGRTGRDDGEFIEGEDQVVADRARSDPGRRRLGRPGPDVDPVGAEGRDEGRLHRLAVEVLVLDVRPTEPGLVEVIDHPAVALDGPEGGEQPGPARRRAGLPPAASSSAVAPPTFVIASASPTGSGADPDRESQASAAARPSSAFASARCRRIAPTAPNPPSIAPATSAAAAAVVTAVLCRRAQRPARRAKGSR